tara:strand:+ start:20743 stop:21996 length:1254 start_codon:yes stop_codon:yes gene_type:complete
MLNILLNFLGINSWYVNFSIVRKKNIDFSFKKKQKRSKIINNVVKNFTPSPNFEKVRLELIENVTFFEKILYSIYTFYSFSIFCLISAQPIYAFIKFINNTQDSKFLVSSFLHLNIPLIYVWAKFYFKTNHFDKLNVCLKFKVSLILISTICSIVFNFIDLGSFNNKYYWLDNLTDSIFYVIVLIEWLYSRLVIFTFIYTFIFIMDVHIKSFISIIKRLDSNEYIFDDNLCLGTIIKELGKIRHDIEYTIRYFNDIIAFVTVIGGVATAIFIKTLLPNGIDISNINIEVHDRYLLHPLILYVVSNIFLLINMSRYSFRRDEILKYIKSMDFMNKFLVRTPSEKIMKKTGDNLDVVILNIAEESATTLDWIILGNILSERWLDFTIFGVSTSDGKLLKKSVALGSTLLFLINILQNNN